MLESDEEALVKEKRRSKAIPIAVSQSSTEAEYKAVANVTVELIWVQSLFREFQSLKTIRQSIDVITSVLCTCHQIQYFMPERNILS
jgi:hypothetical protein